MFTRRVLAASLLLAFVLVPTAARSAWEGTTIETANTEGGVLAVRSVTWSNLTPVDPDLAPLPGPADPAFDMPGRGSYLWLDQNHLNGIPEHVAVTGDGLHTIAGWWLNAMRVTTYDTPGDQFPEWSWPMNVQFQLDVDADQSGGTLTATGRGDSLCVFNAASGTPTRRHTYPPPQVGYRCAVSASGNTYVAASGNPDGTSGEFYVRDATGTVLFKAPLPAPPEGVDVSADGLVVAANVRAFVKVWDAMTGVLRDSVAIPGETQVPAVLSGDGSVLVTGGFSHLLRVYSWNGTDYAPLWTYNMTGATWTTAVAVSDDGSTVAGGGWNASGSFAGRVVLLDIGSATPLWIDANYGDWISALSLTANGSLLAAGSWGRYAGTVGNVISVYERGSASPIHYIRDDAIPGVASCFGIDISANGGYVVAGGKAVHAREFGSGGWVMAIQLTDPAAVEAGEPGMTPALTAFPNPSTGDVRLHLGAPASDARSLRVFAADGSLVRILSGTPTSGWSWDGRDESGRIAAAGSYFVRSEGVETRIVRVR